MWANGERDEALRYLQKFSLDLTEIIRRSTVIRGPEQLPLHVEEAYQKLLARCFLKSGQWQMELNPAWAEVCRQLLPDSVARTEFAIRILPRFSFHLNRQRVTTPPGTNHGIPGHLPMLMSSVTSRIMSSA